MVGTPTRLKPLSSQLSPEGYALARFLRGLLNETGLSLQVYARRQALDPLQVRGFFDGQDIPGPDFVDALLLAADQLDCWEEGRQLRIAALERRAGHEAKVEDLQRQLSDARHMVELGRRRERKLKQQLSAKEAELAVLRQRILDFERHQNKLLYGPLAIEGRQLDERRSLLESETSHIREELIREKGMRQEAERRAADMEKQLRQESLVFANAGGAGILRRQSSEVRAYLSKPLDRLSVFTIVYVGPAYLGIVYGIFSGGWGTLRWITVSGIVLSLYFGYRIRLDSPTEPRTPPTLVRALATTAAIFAAGYLLGHFGHFMGWT
jgi:hypothetical protein